MPDKTSITSYEGTRWECEAFLDSYFSIKRQIAEGALESALSRGDMAVAEDIKDMLDALDGSVYKVTAEPLGMATETPVRPENAYRAMRMQTALEMFDAIVSANKNSSDDNTNS